jgi:hypothetical protein
LLGLVDRGHEFVSEISGDVGGHVSLEGRWSDGPTFPVEHVEVLIRPGFRCLSPAHGREQQNLDRLGVPAPIDQHAPQRRCDDGGIAKIAGVAVDLQRPLVVRLGFLNRSCS